MTADADASAGAARRGRSPFELLRFSATPVPGALVVVEIEGRVAAGSGRFARRPVLVVEPAADRPRLELAPSRATLDGDRWQAAYAIPAEAYDAARFALGLRGTLLDLPAPDEPSAPDRQTLLAREANTLRRQLEAAEAAAASARAEATAAAGELGAAVSASRDEALAESAERISDLEHEVVEAHRLAASDATELRTAHDAALAAKDRALEEATARHDAALAEALAAQERALEEATARHEIALAEVASARDTEGAGSQAAYAAELAVKDRALEEAAAQHDAALAEVDAAQAAEIAQLRAVHEAELAAKDRALDEESAAHDAEVAQLRVASGEESSDQGQRRRVADAEARALAAEEGIGVLRAELAEERERSQGRIGELEQELVAATNRLEALRHATEADASEVADVARVVDLEQQLAAANARVEALRRAAAADAEARSGSRSPGVWADVAPEDDETRALRQPRDGGEARGLARTGESGETRALDRTGEGGEARALDRPSDDDETQVLRPAGDEDPERTQVLAAVPEEDVEGTRRGVRDEAVLPLERGALPRQEEGRGPGAWVAVGALVGFVVVLLVLLGFL